MRIDVYERQGVQWPHNFLFTVYLFTGVPIPRLYEVPIDIESTSLYVLSRISGKGEQYLLRYFKNHQNILQIADEYEVTRQFVSLTIREALENISKSTYFTTLLKYGIIGILDRRIRESYEAGYSDGYFVASAEGHRDHQGHENLISLSTLNLSSRSHFALLRSQYQTVQEVVHLEPQEIARIRNLGKTSVLEIYTKLCDIGLYPSWTPDMVQKEQAKINNEKHKNQNKLKKDG